MNQDIEMLELFDTDALLSELLHRFEHAIFCGLKMPIQDHQAAHGQWHGNSLICVGLAQSIGQSALEHCRFDEGESIEGDEDA